VLWNEAERIVAVLHDIVEVTLVTIEDLEKEGFSQEVLIAIDRLDNNEKMKITMCI
jgi:(p)ppGpp synthase/HD superfamily hydrolase